MHWMRQQQDNPHKGNSRWCPQTARSSSLLTDFSLVLLFVSVPVTDGCPCSPDPSGSPCLRLQESLQSLPAECQDSEWTPAGAELDKAVDNSSRAAGTVCAALQVTRVHVSEQTVHTEHM